MTNTFELIINLLWDTYCIIINIILLIEVRKLINRLFIYPILYLTDTVILKLLFL